ncbi:MAG: M20 family metallopeptidase [Desulfurococcaceae archaeon]
MTYINKEKIYGTISREADNFVKLFLDMISLSTISPEGTNYKEFVELIRDFLKDYGIIVTIETIPSEYTDPRLPAEGKSKPRYLAIIRVGDSRNTILHFNGHYDVVAGGPGWTVTEPFKPKLIDGKVFGRGAGDMKGGITATILSIVGLLGAIDKTGYGIEIFLVPDEEIGGETGTQYITENNKVRGRYVVIAEPTGLNRIYIGQKGRIRGLVIVKGKTAHGASPWLGVNAFERASRLAVKMFDELVPKVESKRSKFKYDIEEASKATLMIGGLLKGGEKINQVPGEVIFSIDRRVIPEETVEDAWREIEEFIAIKAKELGIDVETNLILSQESAVADPNLKLYEAIERSSANITGVKPDKVVCFNGLDMIYYLMKGYEVATYGPGAVGVHAPNEYIEVNNIVTASKIYAELYLNLISSV